MVRGYNPINTRLQLNTHKISKPLHFKHMRKYYISNNLTDTDYGTEGRKIYIPDSPDTDTAGSYFQNVLISRYRLKKLCYRIRIPAVNFST